MKITRKPDAFDRRRDGTYRVSRIPDATIQAEDAAVAFDAVQGSASLLAAYERYFERRAR